MVIFSSYNGPFVILENNKRLDKMLDEIVKEKAMMKFGNDPDDYSNIKNRLKFLVADLEVNKGCITDLDTLERYGNCYFVKKNERLYVSSNLMATMLKTRFEVDMHLFKRLFPVTLNICLSYVNFFARFSYNSETGTDGVLHAFRLKDPRDVNIEISGFGFFNWPMNLFLKRALKVSPNFTEQILQDLIANSLEKMLQGFEFPKKQEEDMNFYSVE
ncbi:uncharacterized protein TNCT_491241 [Trichonephila clavata]|uniref:Uncharacterized protein n=1 Tax=Trichonephila clavata TaxID=2740835 RepID=A0A8X6LVJ5_TRICU|nr:uncharacterized protein TNCT_491241 [Trichonephila clavata]